MSDDEAKKVSKKRKAEKKETSKKKAEDSKKAKSTKASIVNLTVKLTHQGATSTHTFSQPVEGTDLSKMEAAFKDFRDKVKTALK